MEPLYRSLDTLAGAKVIPFGAFPNAMPQLVAELVPYRVFFQLAALEYEAVAAAC